ncbi:MAG: hypothetical protein GVY06_03355 [Alphaproteobacteria bacterium]|jgi:hypothetical protein|nr:hypothetical protein [Alphaproteobacteria bacterium]
MARFTRDEIDLIDRLWRARPSHHVWTGWAAAGRAPHEIWIFRTRSHWRRFSLRKTETGFALFDEGGNQVEQAGSLKALLERVEAIPGLAEARRRGRSR